MLCSILVVVPVSCTVRNVFPFIVFEIIFGRLRMLYFCSVQVIEVLIFGLSFFCLVISKTCLNLAISRIKLLRNKREAQLKHMHKEISQFLQTGQEAIARIRVCLKFLYVYCICFPFWTCFSIYVGFLSFDGEYLTLVGLLGKLLGGACHTRTKHIGRLWYSRIVLRVHSCTYSNSWYPKVDTYVTYLFLYGTFFLIF